MQDEKRMAGKFEIIHALHLGAREVVVGVSPEQEFMCAFCTANGILADYTEVMVSDDYLEIMALYADRLKGQIEAVQTQRKILHIPLEVLGSEQCFPLDGGDDIIGKVVAVKPSALRYEYRRADCQLILVTNGNGARGGSRSTSVYGINVFTGRRDGRWERQDVLGVVRPECLPQWAKEHLPVIERERALEQGRSGR